MPGSWPEPPFAAVATSSEKARLSTGLMTGKNSASSIVVGLCGGLSLQKSIVRA